MHFGRTGIEDHFLDLAAGGAAHDAVVDKDHAFALNEGTVDVELEAHTHVADLLGRLDKRAAHVLVSDDAHAVGDARLVCVANGSGRAAVGDRADEVGLNWVFAGQFDADLAAGLVDRLATQDAVGAREIDMLEDAEAGFLRAEGADRLDTFAGDHHHFARVNLADELRTDDVEGAGF